MVAVAACAREATPTSSAPPAPPPTAAASPQLEASPTTSPTPTATSTTSPAASPTATATSKPSLAASPTPTATSTPRPTPSRSPPAAGTPAPERTPTPTQEPVGIESTPLTLGAPRELPTGWALYYGDHHCEGVYDAFRVADTRDGDTLGVERPWAFFDEQPGYTYSFSVSRGGQTLAVLACERGVCESGHSSPSEDALLALWVSRDDGLVWERQGEAPQGAWISAVAEDDVALQVRTSDQDERPEFRAWWFHAEHEVAASSGIHPAIVIGWYEDAGELRPIWRRLAQPGYAVDSGRPLTSPLGSSGAKAEGKATCSRSPIKKGPSAVRIPGLMRGNILSSPTISVQTRSWGRWGRTSAANRVRRSS